MSWLKEAWAWLCRNVWAVVVALVAMLGAGIFWQYRKGKILKLEDQVALEKARRQLAALDARRKELEKQSNGKAVEIEALRVQRMNVKREVVQTVEKVGAMTDAEVESAFQDLY